MLIARISLAQNNALSLNDAVKIAVAGRYELKIQKINSEIANKQFTEVTTRSFPQISSDLDVRYNSKLQSNILPGSVFGTPDSPGRVVRFGTTYNSLWGFNITQNIFNPGNFSDRKISKLQTEFQKQNEVLTETNIKQEVSEAYIGVLLWKESVKLSEENVKRAEEVFGVYKNLSGMGQATDYDVQRNKIDLENAIAANEKNKKSYELSYHDLLYKISNDSIKIPVLTDSITGLMEQFKIIPSGNEQIKRAELSQENIQLDIYNQNIRKQRMAMIPTVSLYGNYSFQYMNNSFSPFGSANWYPFNYLGAKVSIPILDGGLKARTRQEFELRAQASEYQYNKLQNDYKQETLNALTTLQNALIDLNYQKSNLALIEDLYKTDTDRFKNGTIKQSDLTTTFYTLQQTQNNYLNSVYNYLIAVIRYKKAVGSL